jgi:hypothetical protein
VGNISNNLTRASSFVFPPTIAQRRLWFLEPVPRSATSYLVPWALRLEGELNTPAPLKRRNEIVWPKVSENTRTAVDIDA